MLRGNNLIGFGRRRGSAPSLSYTLEGTDEIISGSSSYSFSGLSLGAAGAGRVLVFTVGAWRGSNRNAVSCKLDGVAMTELCDPGSTKRYAGMFYIPEDTKTIGTVLMTFSGSMNGCVIETYNIQGATSTTPAQSNDSSDSITPSVLPAVVIGTGQKQDGAMDFTGITRDRQYIYSSEHYHVAGSGLITSAGAVNITNSPTARGFGVWN